MIRGRARQHQLWVTHEEVPQEYPDCRYGRIGKLVGDWAMLAKPLEAAFSRRLGRPVDPVLYLKIFLVGGLEGIRYDTQLASRIDDSKRIRNFLGYNLTEPTPDHSSISWARGKIGESCELQPLLEHIVELCLAGGLGDGSVTAVDATLIPANASLDSLRHLETGLPRRDHFRKVKEDEATKAEAAKADTAKVEAKAKAADGADTATAVALKAAAPTAAVAGTEPGLDAEAVTEKPAPKAARRTVSNDEFASLTDPGARIAKKRDKPADMCYQTTTMVDKSKIILAVHVGHADQGEVEAARVVVSEGLGLLNRRDSEAPAPFVLADKGYDAATFHQHVEAHGGVSLTSIRMPHESKPEGLRKANFIYLEEVDGYRCPNGKLLLLRWREPQRERGRYWSDSGDCAECPLRQQCLEPGATTRTISRVDGEASRDRMRALAATEPAKQILRGRGGIVEGPFGFSKEYGGLGLINCRGLAKASVKVMFSAVTWNLLRLLHHVFVDPTRERSKQRRAAHQERRRQERAAKSKGEVDSPIYALHTTLTALLQGSTSVFSLLPNPCGTSCRFLC